MTPPRELWANLRALTRLFKAPFATAGAGTGALRRTMDFTAPLGPAPARVEDSSDLLKRRMSALHLDPDELNRGQARIIGLKTGLCGHCEARGKCLRDLDDEFADPGWGDWRNYCPNATALSILSTLRECEEERDHAAATRA